MHPVRAAAQPGVTEATKIPCWGDCWKKRPTPAKPSAPDGPGMSIPDIVNRQADVNVDVRRSAEDFCGPLRYDNFEELTARVKKKSKREGKNGTVKFWNSACVNVPEIHKHSYYSSLW